MVPKLGHLGKVDQKYVGSFEMLCWKRMEKISWVVLVRNGELLHTVKVKVKCTLVQALRFCTGRTAHRGSRGIALIFHDQRH